MSEPAILANSFELLSAFDEVVSLGYKENASLQQIRNILEGESHEEKIQDIIARVSMSHVQHTETRSLIRLICSLLNPEQRGRGKGRAEETSQTARNATP